MNVKDTKKGRGRRRAAGCLGVLLVVLVLLAVGGGIGWSFVAREHREAASLALNAVDFSRLKDGEYHGAYAGGMYQWRANECDVTVAGGRVTRVELVSSSDPGAANGDYQQMMERVVEDQSLQVDVVSGATLTSKAYLQCVENALLQAQ